MIDRIPNSYKLITLDQYQELLTTENNDILEQIAILLETTSDDPEFDEITIQDYKDIRNRISFLSYLPPNRIKKTLDNFKFKEFNKLTLGEFIDVDNFSNDFIGNLHIICSILYKKNREDDWGNIIEEPYLYDIYDRSEYFKNICVDDIYGIIEEFINYKKKLSETYKNIFEESETEDSEFDTTNLEQEEIDEIKRDIERDKIISKFNWESILWNLSNKDVSKFNDILNQSHILIFNMLGMIKMLES